jgi:hypothetical protein
MDKLKLAVKKPELTKSLSVVVSANSGIRKAIKDAEQNTVGKHMFQI